MSKNIQYHQATPENNKSSFSEFDSIDVVLTAPGRKYLKNSFTVDFELEVKTDGATVKAVGDQIRYNNKIGVHSFFESWSCSTVNGNLEQLNAYPVFMSQMASCTLGDNDYFSAALLAEGRGPCVSNAEIGCEAVSANGTNGADATNDKALPQHCIKPMICFNRMAGDNWSFDKSGQIRVSCNLARAVQAFNGKSAVNASSYAISKVNFRFQTVPDDEKQSPMLMKSYVHVKQTVNSTVTNIQSRVPAKAVEAVSISFLELSKETAPKEDCYALEKLPNIDEVQYLFADNLSNNISYIIDTVQDMLLRGVEAIGTLGQNGVTYTKMSGNRSFIMGQAFDSVLDLSNQKFSTQIKSTSLLGNAYSVNLFFHNIISA